MLVLKVDPKTIEVKCVCIQYVWVCIYTNMCVYMCVSVHACMHMHVFAYVCLVPSNGNGHQAFTSARKGSEMCSHIEQC